MAGNTPIPSEGPNGRMLIGGLAGFCISMNNWKLFIPQNVRDMSNYCVAPYPVLGTPQPYVQSSGMWDVANPPHKDGIYYGQSAVIWLGTFEGTHGYLGTFKISSEEAGHSLAEGGSFQFTAHLIGTLQRLPL